jgi:hypothetical protein
MSNDEHGVLAAERELQAAQRASDVAELDRLLHPDLLAVGPDGSLADKAADLEAHRTGVFTIAELEEEELHVRTVADTARSATTRLPANMRSRGPATAAAGA